MICLSTDKAAYPVNAMGTSKAMMEKVIVAKSRIVSPEKTKICCTRYGNVMCSRGSVIPLWIEQIKSGKPITITEPEMTRFIMSLEEAVDLVIFAFQNGESGDIMVQKAPACTIGVLAQAVRELFHSEDEIKVIGIRHGEKMYETLLTNEECSHAVDMGHFYRVPCDKRGLNYDKYFKEGDTERTKLTEFNSNNTQLLTVEQVKETFRLARELGFDNINMDLIMGLPEEDLDDVRHTLEEIEALRPDSLTVHSLAIKRAARLNMFKEEYGGLKINNTPEMIAMSEACARRLGMEPYYLYRQKNMAGNFENVGYSLPGKACIYNILIMEELQTIAACGAGTTTKVVFPAENRRERCENVKEVEQYISRIDEMIGRKERILG